MIVGRRRGEEKMRIGGGRRWAGRTDERRGDDDADLGGVGRGLGASGNARWTCLDAWMPPGRRDVVVGLLWDAAVLKSHDDCHGGVERCLQVRKWPAFALAGRGGISGPWRSFAD